ncbi:protein rep, partial [Aeromicrobium sp. WCS2018Hpa-33]|uniref:protein rep n=1 Tax=Aeromicrobium sp. WCS2018Hpa-33 TaxID=3073629 RepID=UPI002882F3C2
GLDPDSTHDSEWVRPLRPARCSWRVAPLVGVHADPDRPAHFSGLERCSSIWACPVCSAVIRNERAREIQSAADRWTSAGNSILMLTLTMPHQADDALSTTLDVALDGYRSMTRLRGWQRLRERVGAVGYIRAVEITVGRRNGWHPHVHVLLFVTGILDDDQVAGVQADTLSLWSGVVRRRLGREVSVDHGVRVSRASSADYVAKVQEHDRAGAEMARSDMKRGGSGNLMPFELLDSPGPWARSRWLEYVEATHARRAITWSRGLRALLEVADELTDEELIEQTESSQLVALLDGPDYDARRRAGTLPAVLEAAELLVATDPPAAADTQRTTDLGARPGP